MTELKESTIEELKLEIETQFEEEDLILPEETTEEQVGNLNTYLRFNSNILPTLVAGAGAGTSPTVSLTNANDTKGQINVTTGTSTPTGDICTVTFARNYQTAPIVILTPANAATAALSSGGVSLTKGTIDDNTNVATSTGAGTNTDTVVTHGLGTTPTKITISATIYAMGNPALTGGYHITYQGTAIFNSSGTLISISGVGLKTDAQNLLYDSTAAPPPFVFPNSFNVQGQPTATSPTKGYENIAISLVSIGATYFTFRINGKLVGADPGVSTVTSIFWVAEGGSTPSKIVATPTTTAFTISSTTTALADTTAYSWFYHCLE